MRSAFGLLATAALVIGLPTSLFAGDWLGGEYWGRISGCANCGQSLYGGGIRPWELYARGMAPGCGCCGEGGGFEVVDPYLPVRPPESYDRPWDPWQQNALPETSAPVEILPVPAAEGSASGEVRPTSHITKGAVREQPRRSVIVKTHVSRSERLLRQAAPRGARPPAIEN